MALRGGGSPVPVHGSGASGTLSGPFVMTCLSVFLYHKLERRASPLSSQWEKIMRLGEHPSDSTEKVPESGVAGTLLKQGGLFKSSSQDL